MNRTAIAKPVHYFGIRINGVLGRFSGAVVDAEFQHVTANGLPQNWVAWHLEDGENIDNSERVRQIRDLPLVVLVSGGLALLHHPAGGGCVESPYPMANWRKWING
jgi:hypothetical protein